MLRLLYAIPCENIIVAEEGQHSIIGVLERAQAQVTADAPPKFLIPMKWNVVALWTRDDNPIPEPTEFIQRTTVKTSDGEEVISIDLPFKVSDTFRNFRNLAAFPGFPVAASGVMNIEISLKPANADEWVKHQTFPIVVDRILREVVSDETDETSHEVSTVTSVG